jgi:predicted GH43/DUF377 family glycosyl hydrolase
MYWGEGICFAASSDDLVRWTPVEFDATGDRYLTYDGSWRVHRVPGHKVLKPILFPRVGRFDSLLVEPGPPAVVTDHGIVLLYNGADAATFAYQAGQALFDPLDPTVSIGRTTEPFLSPAAPDEREGQVPDVCFAQGLVLFNGEWRLYFGMADSRVGCAVAPARRS